MRTNKRLTLKYAVLQLQQVAAAADWSEEPFDI